MDLFADLPPPDSEKSSSKNDGGLFGDLPEPSGPKIEKRKPDQNVDDEAPKSKRRLQNDVKYLLKGYVTERMGEREDMQDAHVIMDDFEPEFNDDEIPPDVSRLAYYAIFDGHAGAEAAKFAAQNLHKNIVKKFPKG